MGSPSFFDNINEKVTDARNNSYDFFGLPDTGEQVEFFKPFSHVKGPLVTAVSVPLKPFIATGLMLASALGAIYFLGDAIICTLQGDKEKAFDAAETALSSFVAIPYFALCAVLDCVTSLMSLISRGGVSLYQLLSDGEITESASAQP